MHFFNPVPAMKLVEVIAGVQHPRMRPGGLHQEAVHRRSARTPVEVVNEAPGFVVNKILIPYDATKAIALWQEPALPL